VQQDAEIQYYESVSLMEVHRLVINVFIATFIKGFVIIDIISRDICVQYHYILNIIHHL
jgi:hypothetical protein